MFLILFSDQNDKIIFENIKLFKKFDFDRNENCNYENEIKEKIQKNKISIICSDICGSGKTEYILNNIDDNQNYIYFPLGGYLTREYLLNKLKQEIEIDHLKQNVIHIDLSDSKSENILKEFLFNFLILKYYGYNEKIFNYNYYKARIIIKIELPNTYINYFDKYKILKFIPIEKKINLRGNYQNNIPILKENNIITCIKDSKIQIVSKILKMFNDQSIQFSNPDLYSQDYINKNECNNIIINCLINNIQTKKKKTNYIPNFYQKKIFIDLLSSEFLKFVECAYLYSSNFLDGILNSFINLRLKIIESLIENSIYFIFSPFDSIINEKIDDLSKIQYNIERENKYNEFIEKMQNKMENSINDYDKISPSIVAFHDKEDIGFSLIATSEKDEKLNLINNYFSFYNSQIISQNLMDAKIIENPLDIEKDRKLLDNKLEYLKKEKNEKLMEKILENLKKSKIETPLQLEKDGKLLDNILEIIAVEKGEIDFIKDYIKENFSSYVFTRDNYIKMFLLIMRIRAGIPTILMGETGCGKTHLLEMFSLLYGQKVDYMYTLKFHAGITDKDITDFINKTIHLNNEKEDELIKNLCEGFKKDCLEDERKKKEEYKKEENKKNELFFWNRWFFKIKVSEGYKKYDKEEMEKEFKNKIKKRKIIIFFDEINTCNSLGLIKQIMCDKKYRKANKIPDRFIFICACNPYRILKKENQKLQIGLNLRNKKKRKLVYTVNPLPFSLLNFILDFKDLTEETTKKYIEEIIKTKIGKNEFFEIIEKLIETSHFFIKRKSDISSVSLREIDRFGNLYIFFYEYLEKRKIDKEEKKRQKNSIILSLYFCYYLRLPTSELRKEYLLEIKKIDADLKFEEISERESKFIIDKILEGKKGYAKNRALRENLFCEFICLLNKEPLIICGKPGSSKSLSVRLLLDAMRGELSSNDFFKEYNEVIPSFYQCSITSTSESVEQVFNRARKKLENHEYKINSLVFMDEMGIADESRNNPLKVLHSKLDENLKYKDNEKISFIGISNWSLDASKMNRTVNIVVEEPNINYIIETAKEIARKINEVFEIKYNKIINSISKAYYYYITDYQPNQGKEDFHGFRDFYYLIKYIFYSINENYSKINKDIEKNNFDELISYVLKGIIRNFGGLSNSIEKMEEKFLQYYFKNENEKEIHNLNNEELCKIKEIKQKMNIKYNVIDCIHENIKSKFENRYLLLIGDNERNEALLKTILKGQPYEIISDNNLNEYENENIGVLNLLLKIQLLMEKEIILILKNLEVIYPSLYDLFNKNFSQYGNNKNFAKISFENKQSLLYVNDNFRVIILVEEKYINYEDKRLKNIFYPLIFY